MPLPSAPLGQLPNMNMPFSIPTYEKGPSIWERALASFLVNAAEGTAQAGTKNVFEGEHAQDFGEQGNGFSKLWKGAKVNDAEAKQRNAQKFEAGQSSLGRQSAFDLENTRQAGENSRLATRETGENTRLSTREAGDTARNAASIENQLAIAKQHGASAVELEQMRQTFEQPYQTAKIKETGQLGDYYDSGGAGGAKLKMMQQVMDQLGGPKKAGPSQPAPGSTPQGVDPTVANYHASQQTPTTPQQAALQQFLADPKAIMNGIPSSQYGPIGQVHPEQTQSVQSAPLIEPSGNESAFGNPTIIDLLNLFTQTRDNPQGTLTKRTH